MKKFLFGSLITLVGLVYSTFCFIYAVINPWDYNGITGLMGSFLGTHTLKPFIISMCFLIIGLIICGYEAYRKK